MGKFFIECSHCGTSNKASTFIFAKKVIECGHCKQLIDVKANRMSVGNCRHCGNNVAFDKAKGICPICKNDIIYNKTTTVEDLQKEQVTLNTPNEEEESATETVKKADFFVLRDVNGKIALFDANNHCIKKTDFDSSLLPSKDQKALLEGIEITSLQELLSLMQDYGM